MYEHNSRQKAFHDDPQMFGGLPLKADNRWVELAGLIPWSRVEEALIVAFAKKRYLSFPGHAWKKPIAGISAAIVASGRSLPAWPLLV
ncbi:MAG: hypothetical protein ACOX1U_06625 [Saccharofermentanales bacterium]|jgi:hypothetical protein